MSILQTLSFITAHPLNRDRPISALARFATWQIRSRRSTSDIEFDWVNGTKLMARRGETGSTGNIYCGLHEFADMAFVLHALRPEDLFVDIGSNIGSYSILACGAIGANGICFEPVPSTFSRLRQNIALNQLDSRARCYNTGVGEEAGELRFTSSLDTVNHVVTEGEATIDSIKVPVVVLDEILDGEAPFAIKIDVEGYELPALRGALQTLGDDRLQAVIVELNGSGNRYGYREEDIRELLLTSGLSPCVYDPFTRHLSPTGTVVSSSGNTLFVRDLDLLQQRLRSAPIVHVQGHEL